MRKIILFGATAAALALGAASAYAAGGGNLSPEASPYAVIAPQTTLQSPMSEGRAAYTGADAGYGYGGQSDDDAPRSPARPEDQNYYSRGR